MQGRRTPQVSLSALLALAVASSACSFDGAGPGLSPPESDGPSIRPDIAQDLPPAADAGDLFPWPDAIGEGVDADIIIPPDITVDLPSGIFLDEDFSNGQGDVSFAQGTWSWDATDGGGLRQTGVEKYGNYAVFTPPVGAIGAETLVRIRDIQGIPGVSEGAGLAFRVQAPVVADAAPQMAFCFLSPDANRLAIVVSDGTTTNYPFSESYFFNINPGTTNYRIRGELVDDVLSCELVGQNITVSAPVGPGAGDIALATFYADVTFSSLKVYRPPL